MQESTELDTTVPTDLTISSISDEEKKVASEKKSTNICCKEKKALLKEIQLLKIDISRKTLMLNKLQTELTAKSDMFDEKVKNTVHQNQISQVRLQTQFKLTEEDLLQKINLLSRTLKNTESELKLFKERNEELEETHSNLKQCIENIVFSESKFLKLQKQSKDSLSLEDFIILRFYECIANYKSGNAELDHTVHMLEMQLAAVRNQLKICQKELDEEKDKHQSLEGKFSRLSNDYARVQSVIKYETYAAENFERVKSEHNKLNQELTDLKDKYNRLKTDFFKVNQEKDDANEEIMNLKHAQQLLQKECEHLNRQIADIIPRWSESQDRLIYLQSLLDKEKELQSEMLESQTSIRDKLRQKYEQRLQEQENKLRSEITRSFERDISTLTATKNSAVRKKELLEATVAELRIKYEKLYANFCEKTEYEMNEIRTLHKELDSKNSLIQQQTLSLSALESSLKLTSLENDKIKSRLEVLEEELDSYKKKAYDKILHLETELGQKEAQLDSFKKIENELVEVINATAEVDEDSERALKTYDQFSLPAYTKTAFVRCVHLTRKVMQLEKTVSSLEEKLSTLQVENDCLKQKLEKANELLDSIDQPYSFLISTIRENEANMQKQKSAIIDLEMKLDNVNKEKSAVISERNKLATDLEKVLQHREEIVKMKEQLSLVCNQMHPQGFDIDNR